MTRAPVEPGFGQAPATPTPPVPDDDALEAEVLAAVAIRLACGPAGVPARLASGPVRVSAAPAVQIRIRARHRPLVGVPSAAKAG